MQHHPMQGRHRLVWRDTFDRVSGRVSARTIPLNDGAKTTRLMRFWRHDGAKPTGRVLQGCLVGLATALLTACGGGGGGSPTLSSVSPQQQLTAILQEPSAPAVTHDIATDAFNWINHRRQQAGVAVLSRQTQLDSAAQQHAHYQTTNGVVTHEQSANDSGFTGVTVTDRIRAAGYPYDPQNFAHAEVVFANAQPSGVLMVEQLFTAIYHRFALLNPVFQEVGIGSDFNKNLGHLMTAKLATQAVQPRLAPSQVVTYPVANQRNIPVDFFSDQEMPDPVPAENRVGFPISVQADYGAGISVQRFTIQPRGGAPLATRLLTHDRDPHVPVFAAAIIPLAPLAPASTYEVDFAGAVNGQSVEQRWTFTTM